MNYPYIPLTDILLTDTPRQMDAVVDFCTAWNGPLLLDYKGRKVFLIPIEYYLDYLSTPREAEEIRKQLAEYETGHPEMEAERE